MGLAAELGCPQCGAAIGLDEADHLVTCPFCKVTSFLAAPTYHFILPPKERGDELLFAPYLRFKGVVYCVGETEILHRIADVTCRGLAMPALPLSLGVRPQALRLRFAEPGMGVFLKSRASQQEAIDTVTRVLTEEAGVVHHLCAIGETVSRIYLPISLRRGQAFDAVSGDLLGRLPADRDLFDPVRDPDYDWRPRALAALCPECGWDLEGDPASVVLLCRQCDTAWRAGREGYVRVEIESLALGGQGSGDGEEGLALPFWRIEAEGEAQGGQWRSRADFSRLTGQPYPPRPGWEERPYAFWSPAFKVRPKIYLQAGRQLTILQPELSGGKAIPRQSHPITLPLSEAVEALRLCLASIAYRKKEVMALLPGLDLRVMKATLVFIPFSVTFHDLLRTELGVSINRKALEFGGSL